MEKWPLEHEDPKLIIQEEEQGAEAWRKLDPKRMEIHEKYYSEMYTPGALDVKTKELVAVAIALMLNCKYCIAYHTREAIKTGATREELMEMGFVVATFGGGPAMGYASVTLKDSIDAFEGDYEK